jgi:hypothetical protein
MEFKGSYFVGFVTSSTSGGRSVGIVRSRTKATEFSFFLEVLTVTEYYYLLECDSL